MTRPISDLDVPVTQLTAEIRALVARQREQAGVAAEVRHLFDPADGAFARLACDHPEACACETDYPGWVPGGAQ